jgi:hypothetical protein
MLIANLRACACLLVGCTIDAPVLIDPVGGGSPASQLSELGLFRGDIAALDPIDGATGYDVIAPLWSDGASKTRMVLGPAMTATADHWTIAPGTYLVKTFWFPDATGGRTLVETRVLEFTDDGVREATYVWNADQRDAVASGGNIDVAIDTVDAAGAAVYQTHHVPGTSQCDSCHRGGALGLRTPQLAGEVGALIARGALAGPPPDDAAAAFVDPYDATAELTARATSYLDANCAHCHSPGGQAQGTHADWRRDHVSDAICRDASYSVDGADRVIAPGDAGNSVLIARMRDADPFLHMPRGPSHITDERAVEMLSAWIAAMPRGCP